MRVSRFIIAAIAAIFLNAIITEAQIKKPVGKSKARQAPFELKTLSGIDLKPDLKNGTFTLSFDQQLSGTGNLTLTDAKGRVLHAEPLLPAPDSTVSRRINVGKLKAGLYQIEVKADNILYWKKVRVRR